MIKYHDLNGNGVRDPGEPVLPGWWFDVRNAAGALVDFGITNALGQYCTVQALVPGAATVIETPQSGWVSTDPGGALPTKATILVTGQTVNLEFGNRTPRVCVTKFNDLNGNGVHNTGEPGLPGWVFSVKNASGVVIDSGTTDAQGEWCTTQPLAVGAASVVETQQAGWVSTSPGGATPTRTMTLVAGQTWNGGFGNWMPPSTGKICVFKFQDLNNNGGYDAAPGSTEPLLAGWQFAVAGPSGPLSLTTGVNGTACTPSTLAAGNYTVVETMQPGWTSTVPGGATPQRTVAVTPTSVNNLAFGNVKALPGQICINKYRDLNRNGRLDPGEPPLSGWSFTVRNASGVLIATATTNALGRWCSSSFSALPPGVYTVTEVTQPWWVNTEPQGPPMASPPYSESATLSPTRGADLHFGNIKAGRACITKYNDLNGNGHRDPGEPPLAGVTFRGQYTTWAAAAEISITTDASGVVCVALPPDPNLLFGETMQPGWTSTDPVGMYIASSSLWVFKVFTVVEGQTTQLQFGNHLNALSGRICVLKFNDLNGDGHKQTNEPLLPYWQFHITGPSGPLSGSTANPADPWGQWCTLQVLTPGTYTVSETMKPGWASTTPGGSAPQMSAVVTLGHTTTLTFGNHLVQAPAKLCVSKYNDLNGNGVRDAGEPLIGVWPFTIKDSAGGIDDYGVTNIMGFISSDPDGVWCSTQPLAAGAVSVVETPEPGWISTDPGGATPAKTVILIAGHTSTITFGNHHGPPVPGQICVVKFNDLNGDGHKQASEPLLPNWQFNITGPSGPLSGSTAGANGQWCTPQTLTPGNYSVTETMKPSWVSTDPGGTVPQLPAVVTSSHITTLTFGNHLTPPGVICITKYNDVDQDGMHGAGEAGLPGWVFNLKTSAGASAGSLTTSTQGKACMELPAGAYDAFEVMQTGWSNSDPPGAGPHKPFTVVSNQTVNLVFGNYQSKPKAHDVAITKTGGGNYSAGSALTFVLHVDNIGPGPVGAGGLTVTDTLPAGFSSITANGMWVDWNCTVSGQTVNCNYTGVSVGAGQSFSSIVVHATANSAGSFRNCAYVQYNGGNETALGNNDSCTPITVTARDTGWPQVHKPRHNEKPPQAGCLKGQELKHGICEPLCRDTGEHWNGRKCASCDHGQNWDADAQRCVKSKNYPRRCDEDSTMSIGGACSCRYPDMTQSSPTQCLCPEGKTIVEGQGCVLHCDDPMVPNKDQTRCKCPKNTELKDGECVKKTGFFDHVDIDVGVGVGGGGDRKDHGRKDHRGKDHDNEHRGGNDKDKGRGNDGKDQGGKDGKPNCDPNGPLPCR